MHKPEVFLTLMITPRAIKKVEKLDFATVYDPVS